MPCNACKPVVLVAQKKSHEWWAAEQNLQDAVHEASLAKIVQPAHTEQSRQRLTVRRSQAHRCVTSHLRVDQISAWPTSGRPACRPRVLCVPIRGPATAYRIDKQSSRK